MNIWKKLWLPCVQWVAHVPAVAHSKVNRVCLKEKGIRCGGWDAVEISKVPRQGC